MTNLEEIALKMITTALAAPNTAIRKPLRGGLWLIFRYNVTSWQLSLTRTAKPPSPDEERICRSAFKVPDHAEREKTAVGSYHIIRYQWTNTQLRIFDENPVRAVSGNYYLDDE